VSLSSPLKFFTVKEQWYKPVSVRNERGMEEQRFSSNASTGCIIWEEALRRGSPARALEPKVAYRRSRFRRADWRGNPAGWEKVFWSIGSHH
jgi:hypothetical protein